MARDLAAVMTPPDGGDFGLEIIDGTAANASEAAACISRTVDALLTFPFFGGEKLVWLRNANFLGDTVTGRAADVLESLESLGATLGKGLPEGVRFLLSASEVDKRRAFYKSLSKLGKITVLDALDTSKGGWEEAAMDLVRQIAEPAGVRLRMDALELLAIRTGGDRRTIASELEKIALYVGEPEREVTVEEVSLIVPMTAEAVIFELGNALAARHTHNALTLLQQLIAQKESPIGILLVAVIPTFRNLLAVKELMDRYKVPRPAQPFYFGKTLEKLPSQAVEHLPRKKDGTVNAYALGIAAQHAHRFTVPELRAAQKMVLEANVSLVSSAQDPEGLLQQLVIRLTAP